MKVQYTMRDLIFTSIIFALMLGWWLDAVTVRGAFEKHPYIISDVCSVCGEKVASYDDRR